MEILIKDQEKVVKIIEKLLPLLSEADMWCFDILAALCYIQAEVMVYAIKDMTEEEQSVVLRSIPAQISCAIKVIRKNKEKKEDEK